MVHLTLESWLDKAFDPSLHCRIGVGGWARIVHWTGGWCTSASSGSPVTEVTDIIGVGKKKVRWYRDLS